MRDHRGIVKDEMYGSSGVLAGSYLIWHCIRAHMIVKREWHRTPRESKPYHASPAESLPPSER